MRSPISRPSTRRSGAASSTASAVEWSPSRSGSSAVRRRRTAEEPLAEGDHQATLAVNDPAPDRRVLGREIGERIQAALLGLPDRQRAVFVLRHCEEMTLEEIADSLQMNLGTVKSALHRAVRRLRETLEGVRA